MSKHGNIYSKKQRWKFLLLLLALCIVGFSMFYSKSIVDKIASEERTKVEIWVSAVKKRSALVHYTAELFEKLSQNERSKVQLYLEATKYLARPEITDVGFALKVLNDNTTVPVILTGEKGNITSHRNIEVPDSVDADTFLQKELESMAEQNEPIEIVYYGNNRVFLYYKDSRLFTELKTTFEDLQQSFISELVINAASSPVMLVNATKDSIIEVGNIDTSNIATKTDLRLALQALAKEHEPIEIELAGAPAFVYYRDSFLLTQLVYFPFVQFGIIGLFFFVAYLMFSTSRKAEQNQVWVGMSKETAHQLGTPLSSLMAWMEILKEQSADATIISEMRKDVERLEVITERFSKIGARPELRETALAPVLRKAIEYYQKRSSDKVKFVLEVEEDLQVAINAPLFEWVIENLIKNALDAMGGEGTISVKAQRQISRVHIDLSDTGKGIPASKHKTVFSPGFTTKKRGWGLGLSLSKRIIREYHDGKIFVLKSEVGKGTTFRIMIDLASHSLNPES